MTIKIRLIFVVVGFEWNWILGDGSEASPFVCKVSKDDIYQVEDERGEDFGVDSTNPDDIPSGPVFTKQPKFIEMGHGCIHLSLALTFAQFCGTFNRFFVISM